ncbi:MAG: carbohydrate-binding family 9-like protein [Burkholderiaceae bacterium]|nr:carbohydrate-binding family 9-like protein [Burkholderiaceae bacterium]
MKAFSTAFGALLSAAFGAAAEVPAPLAYQCLRASAPIRIDGKLDDRAWQNAPWSADFVDIEGAGKPRPKFRTRVKMLWDERYLYIAAEMEEPDVKASLTEHDAVIFKDNDFEVFLKPLPATDSYYEFEINALNTGWDLFLPKPYNAGGQPDNSWDIAGLKSAVAVQGSLNQSTDKDRGWTVEMAFPLDAFATRQAVPPPVPGTTWRINFSRVQWTAGKPIEDNWVWSPQGVINMHVPERWGYLHFSGQHSVKQP